MCCKVLIEQLAYTANDTCARSKALRHVSNVQTLPRPSYPPQLSLHIVQPPTKRLTAFFTSSSCARLNPQVYLCHKCRYLILDVACSNASLTICHDGDAVLAHLQNSAQLEIACRLGLCFTSVIPVVFVADTKDLDFVSGHTLTVLAPQFSRHKRIASRHKILLEPAKVSGRSSCQPEDLLKLVVFLAGAIQHQFQSKMRLQSTYLMFLCRDQSSRCSFISSSVKSSSKTP